jgi:hypothetical protein
MHQDSIVVKQVREEVTAEMFESKKYADITPEEKVLVDENLYAVSYRYPVANKYNVGTYRIRLNTEFKKYQGYKNAK